MENWFISYRPRERRAIQRDAAPPGGFKRQQQTAKSSVRPSQAKSKKEGGAGGKVQVWKK